MSSKGRLTNQTTAAPAPTSPCASTATSTNHQRHAGGKRKKKAVVIESAAREVDEDDSQTPKKKKKAKRSHMNSYTVTEEEENTARKCVESSSLCTPTTASSTPSTRDSTGPTVTGAFNFVKDRAAINALLRVPLPNVLADMVSDYLFHPLTHLWEEIVMTYESLPQMLRKGDDTTKQELMPKLQLSPPASPLEVDELEQQFRLKYADPNFHFASELKFLWSIADGLEAPQNMIFRGRFWPSLANMRAILTCPEDSYYVIYHYHAYRCSAWLKHDFRSRTIYTVSGFETQNEPFEESRVVLAYHSMTHFMKALLATLKLSLVNTKQSKKYRLDRDVFWDPTVPDDPHPPALDINHIRGFVPPPSDLERPRWPFLLLDACIIQPDHVLIPGHLTREAYSSIRHSICVNENKWVERVINLSEHEKWVKRAPNKVDSTTNDTTDEYVNEVEVGYGNDVVGSGSSNDEDDSVYDYYGFPVISSCHLLDEFDCYFS